MLADCLSGQRPFRQGGSGAPGSCQVLPPCSSRSGSVVPSMGQTHWQGCGICPHISRQTSVHTGVFVAWPRESSRVLSPAPPAALADTTRENPVSTELLPGNDRKWAGVGQLRTSVLCPTAAPSPDPGGLQPASFFSPFSKCVCLFLLLLLHCPFFL